MTMLRNVFAPVAHLSNQCLLYVRDKKQKEGVREKKVCVELLTKANYLTMRLN